jgi:O-antigen ligase
MDKTDPKRYKIVLSILIFLGIIPILFSQSRGTWASIIPWYITFLLISNKKTVLGIVLVLLLLIGPFVLPQSIKERFSYTFQKQEGWAYRYQERVGGLTLDTSTSERLSSNKQAMAAFTKRPVFGYGITGWRFLDAQYVKTLVETGLVGFTAFGFLLYIALRETRKVYCKTNDKFFKGVSMGFFAGIIAMMTHSLGANTFIIVRIMEPFWFLMAIVISIPHIEEAEKLQNTEENKTKAVAKKKERLFAIRI